ncbi:MAG: NAD(P)/FAD-dependent oxidoreductase [Flavobacterium sp.]|nr:MAG: NAD(P)/FAD-dependent oxidoreductase [Flavobacterium sp.]
MTFDVIILGGGPAGATAAFHIAKAGYKVTIVDKAEESLIGKMLGCGVMKTHTFSSVGLPRSQGKELISFIDTFNIYSPTAKTKKVVSYPSIIVDRHMMNQRLLGYVKEQGVVIKASTEFKSLNFENNKVVGITTSNGENIEAKIVIDASGINSEAKKQVPDSYKIEKSIAQKHIARAYLEELANPEDITNLDSYLAVSEGYIWKTATDIGFGSINPDVDLKATLYKFMKENIPNVKTNPEKNYYGILPIRQNLYNMVGEGYLLVGDSACMISPMEGTGVPTSMLGAKIASEVVIDCLSKNDYSQNALWQFNVKYNKTQGATLAYMDMLRRGLIGLSHDDIDFAFKQDVITDKDVLDSITGDIANVSTLDKAQRAFRGIRRPGILLRMESCMSKSKELKNHYMNYPETFSGLDEWVKKLNQINDSFS